MRTTISLSSVPFKAAAKRGYRVDAESAGGGHVIAFYPHSGLDQVPQVDVSPPLTTGSAKGGNPVGIVRSVALRGREGGATAELGEEVSTALRASQGGADKAHILAFAENSRAEVRLENGDGQVTGALNVGGGKPGQGYPAVAYGLSNQPTPKFAEELSPALDAKTSGGGRMEAVVTPMAVRRLTPLECERLQGFPDGWTEGQADSARYRQLGNAVAVPVFEWIGRRIVAVDAA